ncbi:MAG: hypothetical protein GY719_19930 [bacterium]|nr:hypothetical protein [bacterium]
MNVRLSSIWLSKTCALVLCLAMMPGAIELVENAAHLVNEGHLAHAAGDGDRHEPAGPEHGCTPIFHFCGCHASLTFLGPQGAPAIHLRAELFTSSLTPDPQLAGFRPSVDRPPRV